MKIHMKNRLEPFFISLSLLFRLAVHFPSSLHVYLYISTSQSQVDRPLLPSLSDTGWEEPPFANDHLCHKYCGGLFMRMR